MIKMKQQLKKILGKLFNQKEVSEVIPAKRIHKDISKMQDLRKELAAIESGFNKTTAEKEGQYDIADTKYNEAYAAFTELFQRHKLRLVSEAEVTAEKEKLNPLQEAVRDIGAELDTIKQYKREEIISLLNQMDSLQDDYLNAKAEEMKAAASRLSYMKQQYQQEFTAYVTGCSEVYHTEQAMSDTLQQYGFNNKLVMVDKFSVLVGKPPVPFE